MKPVRVRPRADREIDALADYIARDDLGAALRFLDATWEAFDLIERSLGLALCATPICLCLKACACVRCKGLKSIWCFTSSGRYILM